MRNAKNRRVDGKVAKSWKRYRNKSHRRGKEWISIAT